MPEQRNELDVAWAAGLFEGEGCWNAHVRNSGKVQIQARLGMTDRDVVVRFATVVGFGRVNTFHTAFHKERGDKPMHTWSVYEAEKVRELIALFMPYMGDRRRAKALEVLDKGRDVQSHHAKKTHCPRHHPLSGENLILEPIVRSGRHYVARRCRICRSAEAARRYERRKAFSRERE